MLQYAHGSPAEFSERGYRRVGDKSPKNTDKKRKQQTQQASKEKKQAAK